MNWAIKTQNGDWLTSIGYFRVEKCGNSYLIVFKHYIAHSEFCIEDFETEDKAKAVLDNIIHQVFGENAICVTSPEKEGK